jgi:hypothetical protein
MAHATNATVNDSNDCVHQSQPLQVEQASLSRHQFAADRPVESAMLAVRSAE